MREKYSVLLILLATAASVAANYDDDDDYIEIPTKCPKVNPMNYTVHLAHEWDCTKFYKCNWGQKILMNCPYRDQNERRLHFNRILQVCDWPWSAGCTTDKCPPVDSNEIVLLPHEDDCSRYYRCIKGKKVPKKCPPGQLFDHDFRTCVNDDDAECHEWATTEPGTTTPKQGGSEDCVEGILKPHECHCDKYYECKNGKLVLQHCSKCLHFDPKSGECDCPAKVGCELEGYGACGLNPHSD